MSELPRSKFSIVRWLCVATLCATAIASATASQGGVARGQSMASPTLGHEIPYSLYRPSGHSDDRLPVLYLLHGHGDDETAWLDKGGIAQTLDRLIGAGRIVPLMVVMPMAGNSWYVDDARGRAGYGAVARAMVADLIAGIDARYPTDACRERRAIGGLSMGGFGAVLYAFEHPDRFTAAISLSGSLFVPNLSTNPARRQRLSRLFGGVYGEPFDMNRFNRWTVFARVEKVSALSSPPSVWLAAGDDDFPAILRGTVALHLALKRRGVATELRVDNARHTWRYWSKAIVPALEWLAPQLSRPCVGSSDPKTRDQQDTAAHR